MREGQGQYTFSRRHRAAVRQIHIIPFEHIWSPFGVFEIQRSTIQDLEIQTPVCRPVLLFGQFGQQRFQVVPALDAEGLGQRRQGGRANQTDLNLVLQAEERGYLLVHLHDR